MCVSSRQFTRAQKGSQPRLAALGSPFQGKGLAWILPPSYGRRCPEGAEVGGKSGMKKSEGDRLKCVVYESTLSTAARSPFPNGEGKEEGLRRPKRKPTPPRCARQPLPREGARVDTPSFLWKEVPRRGGGWGEKRDEKERGRSSQVRRLREHPIHRCAVPLPQWGRQRGGASPPQKEATPASLRSAAPSKGRGSRGHSLLPMEGGAPKGRRLDGGSGMKESEENRLKCVVYEST